MDGWTNKNDNISIISWEKGVGQVISVFQFFYMTKLKFEIKIIYMTTHIFNR